MWIKGGEIITKAELNTRDMGSQGEGVAGNIIKSSKQV